MAAAQRQRAFPGDVVCEPQRRWLGVDAGLRAKLPKSGQAGIVSGRWLLSPRYRYLPQVDIVIPGRERLENELLGANVITVDVPALSRLECVARLIPCDTPILMIAHQPADEHLGLLNYVDTAVSSTAEPIYYLCIGLRIPFDAVLATCIYTGIAFDTGRFRFSCTTPNALVIAGEWCALGSVA